MYNRTLHKIVEDNINKNKAIIILGPRQTGKTTLLKEVLSLFSKPLILDCDDKSIKEMLQDANTQKLKQIVGNADVVFIDEAQRVKDIGLTLKIIKDQIQDVQLLVSGSSSLELLSEINEPLTGRKREFMLLPISWAELMEKEGYVNSISQLDQRLVFGMYPEVLNNKGNEIEELKQLANSYLYKDLLSYKGIRKPELIDKLLKALAFQVGSEVSLNELSQIVGADKNTVNTYIDLLEKAFVIFRLHPLSRNLRNEISTSRKIYFYDNGIRNTIISNFNSIELRNDIGALWENFLISERIKHNEYKPLYCNTYFWRTTQKQEIDYIEEHGGEFYAYEFKWNPKKRAKLPAKFNTAYPNHQFNIINKENFIDFVQF